MTDSFRIGGRIQDGKGYRGFVRFDGEVGSTKGRWLGVDWDVESRGKHDGSHEGVVYFKTSSPISGSFVRPTKVDGGISFKDAVEERYGSLRAHEEFIPEEMKEIQREMNASIFEIVGFDKVRKAQGNFAKLQVISVRNMRVEKCDGESGKFVPEVVSLDLAENLFTSWDEVINVVHDLSRLRHLLVSENRLSLPQSRSFRSLPPLKHLVLGRMNYNWNEDIVRIVKEIPTLEILQVHGNSISCVSNTPEELAEYLPNLIELDMNLNPLVNWSNVSKFGNCPKLSVLKLNDCQLKSLDHIENRFKKLEKIELNFNDFQDWTTLGRLQGISSLRDIRLRGDELKNVNPKDTPKNRNLSPRQTIIAMLGKILVLNGTEIDRQERFGAEIDYVKFFGLDYIKDKKNSSLPRYEKLVSIHGEPEESELKNKDTGMSDMFLQIKLKKADEVIEKKISRTMTVKALKILSKKLFKSPNLNIELSYTNEKKPDVSVPFDDDMRELTYFGIVNGDTVKVHW